jgi:ferritin-like metal-binding protein YciE
MKETQQRWYGFFMTSRALDDKGGDQNGACVVREKNQAMKAPKRKTTGREPRRQRSNGKSPSRDQRSQLQELFENELKDIYWAEKALTKAIPKMIKNATSQELISALENHLKETEGHVQRCEQVFEVIGKKAEAKKCEAMAGLIKEASEIMDDSEEGAMLDAGIISAGQKVEHYEIASYGTLRTFASTLGLDDAVDLLEQTLEEEKAADEKLTGVAESVVNLEAAGEPAEQ